MKKSFYYNYIDERLSTLATQIETNGKLNMLHLNVLSETFYADMLNILLDVKLVNVNRFNQNTEAIDLIDKENKILSQVSSTATKQKIEDSLSKKTCANYSGYSYKFVSISKDAALLRDKTYNNPYNLLFEPKKDIFDLVSIKESFLSIDIDTQKSFYELIKKELGHEPDIIKIDSNLAAIINILAKENLSDVEDNIDTVEFEISKKIEVNNLSSIKSIFDENKIYYSKLNQKYDEFDKQGANKSLSILKSIHLEYVKLSSKGFSGPDLFYKIIDSAINIVINSKNYIEIPSEELEMCVYIIIVDAFMKCKIFKNPEEL